VSPPVFADGQVAHGRKAPHLRPCLWLGQDQTSETHDLGAELDTEVAKRPSIGIADTVAMKAGTVRVVRRPPAVAPSAALP
jgi:hypothetical protein